MIFLTNWDEKDSKVEITLSSGETCRPGPQLFFFNYLVSFVLTRDAQYNITNLIFQMASVVVIVEGVAEVMEWIMEMIMAAIEELAVVDVDKMVEMVTEEATKKVEKEIVSQVLWNVGGNLAASIVKNLEQLGEQACLTLKTIIENLTKQVSNKLSLATK